jgi:hypothetical protein
MAYYFTKTNQSLEAEPLLESSCTRLLPDEDEPDDDPDALELLS